MFFQHTFQTALELLIVWENATTLKRLPPSLCHGLGWVAIPAGATGGSLD